MKRTISLLVITSLLIAGAARASVIATFNTAGDWTGLQNLDILGGVYNVEFRHGTVLDAYGNPPVFTFSTPAQADVASFALANYRLNNIPLPTSPQDPNTTLAEGCGASSCAFLVPYDIDTVIYGSSMDVYWEQFDNQYHVGGSPAGAIRIDHDTSAGLFSVWAVFTPVPVPAAVWLFGSGLLCLLGVARRKTI